MSSTNVLGAKDVNAPITQQSLGGKPDVKSMEYHRQVLQSKMAEAQYVEQNGVHARRYSSREY